MKTILNKKEIELFSRQIILKKVGLLGQKKIKKAKVLIIGVGGLGCPAAEYLVRAGIGVLGIVDDDTINLSNIHRQSLFNLKDLNKSKVNCAKNKLNKINPKTKIYTHNLRIKKDNAIKLFKMYDFVVDGSDNFETKFLINDLSVRFKKKLVLGAISKFDGHVFTYDFLDKKTPCLRCFFQEDKISDDMLNCENEGILGSVTGVVGTLQATEILKQILGIGKDLNGQILILDLLNLNFRKAIIKKRKKCIC
tara:strand:+ start:2478 stop:3230 length:753 start_codon:yes stop_codon:yes gene_type:complete